MTFYKIKRIDVFENGEIVFILRSGLSVIKHNGDHMCCETGEVLDPLYDEFTQTMVGFTEAHR